MYINYAEQFVFPGFTRIKCPQLVYSEEIGSVKCNADILVENEAIRNRQIGDVVVECTQNPLCMKRFCYNCKSIVGFYNTMCMDCKRFYENENPNIFNYYFNKNIDEQLSCSINENVLEAKSFEESDYLYLNREITVEIAASQITKLINDVHSVMICPICKISLYKTEKCNGLSHHCVERCYACCRMGSKITGLGEHWSSSGVGGCFRFDYDTFVKQHAPLYKCNDAVCTNHDRGDCWIPEHQEGITQLSVLRKKAYVYHMLKSLLPSILHEVYDKLTRDNAGIPTFLEYLPNKQTFVLTASYKKRNRDYLEDIVYSQLQCPHPRDIPEYVDKNFFVSAEDFVSTYAKPPSEHVDPPSSGQDIFWINNQQIVDQIIHEEADVDDGAARRFINMIVARAGDIDHSSLITYQNSDPDTVETDDQGVDLSDLAVTADALASYMVDNGYSMLIEDTTEEESDESIFS
jgi:hypothetical protein